MRHKRLSLRCWIRQERVLSYTIYPYSICLKYNVMCARISFYSFVEVQ